MKPTHFFITLGSLFVIGCTPRFQEQHLSSIQIYDRNGFQETISSKERLEQYESADFTEPQVYERIVRTYQRSDTGTSKTIVTSYHENGLLKQYLEGENGRARGLFREFYTDGTKKIEVLVIEGIADFTPEAMQKWVFDGISNAWDEHGQLRAEIPYHKGKLHGEAFYYHENGEVKKIVPYLQDKIHGIVREYNTHGLLVGEIAYELGDKHGVVRYLGTDEIPAYTELYQKGKLVTGEYTSPEGEVVSRVVDGNGTQTFYTNGHLDKVVTIQNGACEGEMQLFDDSGALSSKYNLCNGEKHGEEIVYYPNETPKLLLTWHRGEILGKVKTWYQSGGLQSEVEMHDNAKHGICVTWYEDGSLLHVEEYEHGVLVDGKYFKKGEGSPISKIEHGNGIAHLFDGDGVLLEKVMYKDGIPEKE